jgi:hypothetical protein
MSQVGQSRGVSMNGNARNSAISYFIADILLMTLMTLMTEIVSPN